MEHGSAEGAFDREYAALVAQYRRKLDGVAARAQSLAERGRLGELRELVHRIAGSAGNHGLGEVSLAAKEVLSLMPTDVAAGGLTGAQAERFAWLLSEMRRSAG